MNKLVVGLLLVLMTGVIVAILVVQRDSEVQAEISNLREQQSQLETEIRLHERILEEFAGGDPLVTRRMKGLRQGTFVHIALSDDEHVVLLEGEEFSSETFEFYDFAVPAGKTSIVLYDRYTGVQLDTETFYGEAGTLLIAWWSLDPPNLESRPDAGFGILEWDSNTGLAVSTR